MLQNQHAIFSEFSLFLCLFLQIRCKFLANAPVLFSRRGRRKVLNQLPLCNIYWERENRFLNGKSLGISVTFQGRPRAQDLLANTKWFFQCSFSFVLLYSSLVINFCLFCLSVLAFSLGGIFFPGILLVLFLERNKKLMFSFNIFKIKNVAKQIITDSTSSL